MTFSSSWRALVPAVFALFMVTRAVGCSGGNTAPARLVGKCVADCSSMACHDAAGKMCLGCSFECCAPADAMADAMVCVGAGDAAVAPGPTVSDFVAAFDQACFCTRYTVAATDSAGAALSYAWTDSNPCGSFVGGNRPMATWTHPDSTMPGACPNEPVHPGTITVVVTGTGGSTKCAYGGGSGSNGGLLAQVVCTPVP